MKEKQKIMGFEVLEEYKKGRRDFSNVHIAIGEFAGADMSGIILRNCKIEDATFRGGKLVNADFSGSEIIFTGFTDANLTRAKFNNCYIKWAVFDRAIFDETEMKNADIVWSLFLNTNISCVDFSNSRQYKNVTDLSQMTEAGLQEAIREFGTYLNAVDFEGRLHMRVIANKVMKDYGRKENTFPKIEAEKNQNQSNANVYSKMLGDIIEETIKAYKQKHPYKQKSAYDKPRTKTSYGGK